MPPPPIEPESLDIDYSLLLIDLAEEYFDIAYGRDPKTGLFRRHADRDYFCELIATGLGCLEVVLRVSLIAVWPVVTVFLTILAMEIRCPRGSIRTYALCIRSVPGDRELRRSRRNP